MHLVTVRAILGLALVCSGCGAPQLSVGTGTRAWSEPSPWGLDRAERDDWVVIPGYGYSPLHRPSIVCDRFGRCWQRAPYDRFARGYVGRGNAEPPEWAENLPDSARVRDRFLRPRANVVCDRATRICYKKGEIDKSDTESVFGERAGDRADDIRDRRGSARVFAPERDVSCDRERRVCYEDGEPDRGLTRRYFGRRAARGLD